MLAKYFYVELNNCKKDTKQKENLFVISGTIIDWMGQDFVETWLEKGVEKVGSENG